ncbi:MAG: 3-keto-5-aminohexanoate cleavage protein [Thermodesulfobacteriota bacterium]
MKKVIITVAVTGSHPTKEMNPAVPYSPAEIAAAAVECCRAGAAIAHIHVRDPETGRPAFRLELFREVVERIRDKCDLNINLTTSGFNIQGDDIIAQRLQPLSLKPELCSLDIGSVNFRDRVFVNPPEWGLTAAKRMRAAGVKPEIEVFDIGHIYQALALIQNDEFEPPPYFQLCMGTRWGIEATPENLLFMKSKLPPGAEWSVLGVGKSQLSMITMALILGGHIRVGFEDNLFLRKGAPAKSNAQFVEMAAELVRQLQREVATPAEARDILGISKQA